MLLTSTLALVELSIPGPDTPEMSEDWRRGRPEEEDKPSILPRNYARVVEYLQASQVCFGLPQPSQ